MNKAAGTKHSVDYNRGYKAGYTAGRNAKTLTDEDKRLAVYTAALQGLLATSKRWQSGGKDVTKMEGYCKLASDFTNETMKKGYV